MHRIFQSNSQSLGRWLCRCCTQNLIEDVFFFFFWYVDKGNCKHQGHNLKEWKMRFLPKSSRLPVLMVFRPSWNRWTLSTELYKSLLKGKGHSKDLILLQRPHFFSNTGFPSCPRLYSPDREYVIQCHPGYNEALKAGRQYLFQKKKMGSHRRLN